uniref:Fibulin-1 n=1 Tax=Syphacia muris TaxID=451379 RepID=A0A0N5AH31_9BILA
MFQKSCLIGMEKARSNSICTRESPKTFYETDKYVEKECCECCKLGLIAAKFSGNCKPPITITHRCSETFKKCCSPYAHLTFQDTQSKNFDFLFIVYKKCCMIHLERTESINLRIEDRCATAKCEHFCNDGGGDDVECSCKEGYELKSDGYSCVEEIVNNGQSDMYKLISNSHPPVEILTNLNRTQKLLTEESDAIIKSDVSVEARSITCRSGWIISENGICIDIDECLLSVDNCLEGQLCINTPGSYRCIRTLSCGTGYTLSSDSEQCIDVDECSLGTHDCGPMYVCRNTQGSYRCDPRVCPVGQILNSQTGECSTIDCPAGYRPSKKGCVDVDECQTPDRCRHFEECINTPGSYRCQERGNLCTDGHRMDRNTGFCVDIDECAERTHSCESDMQCINLDGSYKCRCSAGFFFNETTKKCEDINECERYAGHVCSLQASCENTYGSFRCRCMDGYKLAADGRNCEDIDECELRIAKCAQRCVNIPGSYQCVCNRGYHLSADGITCEDIDECALWAGIATVSMNNFADDLCMGTCINTPGSFRCQCPKGYILHADGRTCIDIDECQKGECQGSDKFCVNTLGSYKCHHIQCPNNYVHDKNYKNRCTRHRTTCARLTEDACKDLPLYISWKYIAIPRLIPFSDHRTSVTLFTVKGPANPVTTTQFELNLKHSLPERSGVLPAVRNNFLLQKGKTMNSAIIAIRDSLDGPQEIELELVLRLSVNNKFHGKFIFLSVTVFTLLIFNMYKPGSSIADGYSCLKRCQKKDIACFANHTEELLYQFRALPTIKYLKEPIEISKLQAQMDRPFSVVYKIDMLNRDKFRVEQTGKYGTELSV